MSVGTIQIPVLFDMSGDSIVYGEDATGADFVDSHLQFLLDMTTEANGISLNASDTESRNEFNSPWNSLFIPAIVPLVSLSFTPHSPLRSSAA